MTNKKKYIKAAKLLVKAKNTWNFDYFACHAILSVKLDTIDFRYLFSPEGPDSNNKSYVFWGTNNEYCQLQRSLALLLMAEMEES